MSTGFFISNLILLDCVILLNTSGLLFSYFSKDNVVLVLDILIVSPSFRSLLFCMFIGNNICTFILMVCVSGEVEAFVFDLNLLYFMSCLLLFSLEIATTNTNTNFGLSLNFAFIYLMVFSFPVSLFVYKLCYASILSSRIVVFLLARLRLSLALFLSFWLLR